MSSSDFRPKLTVKQYRNELAREIMMALIGGEVLPILENYQDNVRNIPQLAVALANRFIAECNGDYEIVGQPVPEAGFNQITEDEDA